MISIFNQKIAYALLITLCLTACQSTPSQDEVQGTNAQSQALEATVAENSSAQNLPKTPRIPSNADQAIQSILDTKAPEIKEPLNEASPPQSTSEKSEAFIKASQPKDIEDCNLIKEINLKELCYQAGSFGKNSPSTQSELGE